jgi:hypothetical protein
MGKNVIASPTIFNMTSDYRGKTAEVSWNSNFHSTHTANRCR